MVHRGCGGDVTREPNYEDHYWLCGRCGCGVHIDDMVYEDDLMICAICGGEVFWDGPYNSMFLHCKKCGQLHGPIVQEDEES